MSAAELGYAGAVVVLGVAMLRALPVLFAFYASDAPPAWQKVVALLGYCALVFTAARYAGLAVVQILLTYAYLLPVSGIPYLLAKRRPPRAVLLAATMAIFLVGPAWALPEHWLIALLGWDLAMASYSFCVDAPDREVTPRRYAFFLFVNPTLVYPARGSRVGPARFSMIGALRVASGLAALFLSGVVSEAARWLAVHAMTGADAAQLAGRFGAIYLAHTGLASLQIGLMHQLGYRVPERYDRVLSARSPIELWSRWNTYVATWARLYLFTPTVRFLLRRVPRGASALRMAAYAVATVATFTATGLLHELYGLVERRTITPGVIAWFAANGLLVVVWHGASERFRARPAQAERRHVAFARGALFATLVVSFALHLP